LKRSASINYIFITVVLDVLSLGIIIPVLPKLVEAFLGGDTGRAAQFYGLFGTAWAMMQFIFSPLLGTLSDRFGRRPVILLSNFGLGFDYILMALSPTVWWLFVGRIFSGICGASWTTAAAYVADITEPEKRAGAFGRIGAAWGLGFVLGPALGGVLGGIDLRLPFWVAAGLTLANAAYGMFVLPESLPADRRRPVTWRAGNPLASLKELTQLQGIGPLVVVLGLSGLAQFTLYTTWVLHNSFKFGWGPTENGWSLFAVGMVSAVVQGGLMGRLLKVFPAWRLALMGLASSTLAYIGWGAATAGWVVYLVIVANVLGNTIAASMNSIFSGAADATEQGRTMGSLSSLNSLMAIVAPLIAAPLLGAVSHLPQGDWRLGAPMFFCAVLQAGALVLAWTHFRRSGIARQARPSPAA